MVEEHPGFTNAYLATEGCACVMLANSSQDICMILTHIQYGRGIAWGAHRIHYTSVLYKSCCQTSYNSKTVSGAIQYTTKEVQEGEQTGQLGSQPSSSVSNVYQATAYPVQSLQDC